VPCTPVCGKIWQIFENEIRQKKEEDDGDGGVCPAIWVRCLGGPFAGRLEIGNPNGKGFQIVVQLSFVSLVFIGVVHKLMSPSSPPPLSNAASQDRKNSRIYIVAARLGAARLRSDGRNRCRI